MEDNSDVWQLKTSTPSGNKNKNKTASNSIINPNHRHGLVAGDDQRSVSSFDTDDETNLVAAANSSLLHRPNLVSPRRIVDSLGPFPAHQVVLDDLIRSKCGPSLAQKDSSANKLRQTTSQAREAKQIHVPRPANHGSGSASTDDKHRTNVKVDQRPEAKRSTANMEHQVHVTLRRSNSKPTTNLMAFAQEEKTLKTSGRNNDKQGSNINNNNNTATSTENIRSSLDLKNARMKSFKTMSSSNARKKFDDNDEYVLSPMSPPPSYDPTSIEDKPTIVSKLPADKFSKTLKTPERKTFNNSNINFNNSPHTLATPSSQSPPLPSRTDHVMIVAPPPPLLSIDSSRWKNSSSSPAFEVNCDVTSGAPKINRPFSDKSALLDVSSSRTSEKMSQEMQSDELLRLRQDLQWAKDQVTLLTSHLCTNTKVVEAFDSTLNKMLLKLQSLSSTGHLHNPDLNRLMDTIEALRQQNINHCIRQTLIGHSSHVVDSDLKGSRRNAGRHASDSKNDRSLNGSWLSRDHNYRGDLTTSGDSRGVIISSYYGDYKRNNWDDDDDDSLCDATSETGSRLSRRRYKNETDAEVSPERDKLGYFKSKLKSKKSKLVDSHESQGDCSQSDKKSVKHWLKSSFGRALSRIRTPSVTSTMTPPNKKDSHIGSLPSIPLQVAQRPLSLDYYPAPSHASNIFYPLGPFKGSHPGGHDLPSTSSGFSSDGTEFKFEDRLRSNERFANNYFKPIETNFELPVRPATSLASPYHRRSESTDQALRPTGLELRANKRTDGQHVTVSVAVDQVDDNTKQNAFVQGTQTQIPIGTVKVGDVMTWMVLDRLVKKTFEDHLARLDPVSKLGMNGESILNYRVGEVIRSNDDASFMLHPPELLPIGYLVGDVTNITVTLKGHREGCIDALAFELLIPKPNLSSYVHLLINHKRIIFIGSSGTGKSHLAKKLAGYLVDLMLNWCESSKGQFESEFGSNGNLFPPLPYVQHHQHQHQEKVEPSGWIAVYRVDSQSSRELRQYLNNVAQQYQDLYARQEQPLKLLRPVLNDGTRDTATIIEVQGCRNEISGIPRTDQVTESLATKSSGKSRNYGNSSTPLVIVLDNLHHVTSLGDAFCGFFELDAKKGPYVIGTMQWSPSSTSSASSSSSPPAAAAPSSPTSSSQTPSPTLGGPVASSEPLGDLQFHHNFRWIIYSNKVDPVRRFLGRYLNRRLVASTVAKTSLFSRRSLALSGTSEALPSGGTPMTSSLLDLNLSKVIDWLPQVWQKINSYLELSSTRDVTLGPRLFLSCPMDTTRVHVWFVDLWNYSIVPYLMEALKSKTHHGIKPQWTKLTDWLTSSMPWKTQLDRSSCPLFLNFRPEDLGVLAPQQKYVHSIPEVTSVSLQKSKLRDDGDDDDVFHSGMSSDLSLVDIVSRFQAVAICSSSSETGSINTTANSEVE